MKNVNQMGVRAAFTIVELLTVMAVIAILIGLLVPALGLVQDAAKDLQQKAQFHGIKVGLQLYKTEYGDYPESDDNQFDTAPSADTTPYSGAHKLAEAMLGHDLMGFHPKSEFRADGYGLDPLGGGGTIDLYDDTTLEEREERFVDLEKANAYQLSQIYDNTVPFSEDNFVLCDSYSKRRQISGKKTGMPILYYRADTRQKIQDSATDPDLSIYDYRDNLNIIELGVPDDDTFTGHTLNDPVEFDDAILNDQIFETTNIAIPYRDQSFILISAGKDGIYGNADDVYNFDKEK